MSFFDELKRRNVLRVGIAYIVAGWLLTQVVQVAAESFEAPVWVMKMLISLLIIGLPITLFFSWAYEITPEGIRKETDIKPDRSITHETAKKLDYMTMALLATAIAFLALDRFVLERPVPEPAGQATVQLAADPPVPAVELNSIAVLPFVNMSADPEQEFFSEGISEELLNLLVRVEGLTVASRTSSFAYKGETTSIPQIAKDLKVANILEGSVRKSGNRVRITAQLIDTRNDRHLWSDSYDRELTDIFAIQDEIANAIVNALRAELGIETGENAVAVAVATDNLDAYELFLKARSLLIARSDLAESVRLFEQAVALDPDFARAWAGLGAAAWVAPAWNFTDRDYNSIARMATEKALELDENQSMAWAVLSNIGDLKEGGPDYDLILGHLDKALEKDPKNTTAWLWRGLAWTELGFHERALEDVEKCLEIDPAYMNCILHASIINILLGDHHRVVELTTRLARNDFLVYMAIHIPYMVRRGELLGASLAVFNTSRHRDFPGEEWLDALQHPERDHSLAVARAEKWLQQDDRVGMHEALMMAFGAYDKLGINYGLAQNWIWQPGFPGFHESGHFKRLVNRLNLPVYWRKRGFPPQCQPVGEQDFECD